MGYSREITRREIAQVIDQFGDAARVAAEAGFDAVELHFGHLYLPSSFLSPLINRRKDEYGGDIDNRLGSAVRSPGECAMRSGAASR